MLSNQYPIRSLLPVRSNVSDNNEDTAESATTDQDSAESAAVGDIDQQEVEESEIVQDAQENHEKSEESGVTSDSDALDHNPESEDHHENIVQDAQNQNTGNAEESEKQNEEREVDRSENVKEYIKEIVIMQQEEADIQTVQVQSLPEDTYISTDDYNIMTILLMAAVLGALVASAFLNVINRGM